MALTLANTLTLASTSSDLANNGGTTASAIYSVDTRAPSFTFQLNDASNSGATSDRITNDDTPTISGTGTADDIIVSLGGMRDSERADVMLVIEALAAGGQIVAAATDAEGNDVYESREQERA